VVGSRIRAVDLLDALAPDGWLGEATPPRFATFADARLELPADQTGDFFAARGLESRARVAGTPLPRDLVDLDLRAIAHGMAVLHSERAEREALRRLPGLAREPLRTDPPTLDHVGVEVFGRLDWYVEAIAAWAAGGTARISHHRIFPSVQVRRALAYDPRLGDVRIARIHLQVGRRRLNLELFEAMQDWRYTVARQLALFCDRPRDGADRVAEALHGSLPLPLEPVGHLALRVERWQTVDTVHRTLADPVGREASRRLHDERPSYNAADRSLNTKILTTNGTLAGAAVFGRVVELISYGVGRPPGALERLRGTPPTDGPAVGA